MSEMFQQTYILIYISIYIYIYLLGSSALLRVLHKQGIVAVRHCLTMPNWNLFALSVDIELCTLYIVGISSQCCQSEFNVYL